ncbi:hypothetical protein BsWGS_16978 [Bradybaena similaris]
MQTRPSAPPTVLRRAYTDIPAPNPVRPPLARAKRIYDTIDPDFDPYATIGPRDDLNETMGSDDDPYARIGRCDDPNATIGRRDDPYATIGSPEDPYATIGSPEDPYAKIGQRAMKRNTLAVFPDKNQDVYATIDPRTKRRNTINLPQDKYDDVYATIGPRAIKRNTLPVFPDKNEDVYATIDPRTKKRNTLAVFPDKNEDVYATIDPRTKKRNTIAVFPDKNEDVYATIDPRTKKRNTLAVFPDKNEDVYARMDPTCSVNPTSSPNAFEGKKGGPPPLPPKPSMAAREGNVPKRRNVPTLPQDKNEDVYARMDPTYSVNPTSSKNAFEGKKGGPPPLPPKPSMAARQGNMPPPVLRRAPTPYEIVSPSPSADSITYEFLPESPTSPRTPGKNAASAFDGKDFQSVSKIPPLPPPRERQRDLITVFGSGNVYNLSQSNYDGFIRDKEKALVIFYDANTASFASLAREFGHAADTSQHDNHGYGAVDCAVHPPLCCQEKITRTPSLKLFSNGFILSTINEASTFTTDQMNQLVTLSPVLTKPRGT